MSAPKIKPNTKAFSTTSNVLPVEHRHHNYSSVIARMYASGICSERKAKEMKERVDAKYGEVSE
jgi:hypothetical protein